MGAPQVSLSESLTLILVYVVYLALVIVFNYYKVTLDYTPRRRESASAAELLAPGDHAYSVVDTVGMCVCVCVARAGGGLPSCWPPATTPTPWLTLWVRVWVCVWGGGGEGRIWSGCREVSCYVERAAWGLCHDLTPLLSPQTWAARSR
jgi:hypothetical protein